MPVTVKGGDRLEATLDAAATELARMTDAHRQVSGLVARAARPPRRTGRLAGSVRPAPTATAPWSKRPPVRGRRRRRRPVARYPPNPFLRKAATATESAWLEIYGRAVQGVLDDVKGA